MSGTEQLRELPINDVYIMLWEGRANIWGVIIWFQGGSSIMQKVGSKAQAQQRVLTF